MGEILMHKGCLGYAFLEDGENTGLPFMILSLGQVSFGCGWEKLPQCEVHTEDWRKSCYHSKGGLCIIFPSEGMKESGKCSFLKLPVQIIELLQLNRVYNSALQFEDCFWLDGILAFTFNSLVQDDGYAAIFLLLPPRAVKYIL